MCCLLHVGIKLSQTHLTVSCQSQSSLHQHQLAPCCAESLLLGLCSWVGQHEEVVLCLYVKIPTATPANTSLARVSMYMSAQPCCSAHALHDHSLTWAPVPALMQHAVRGSSNSSFAAARTLVITFQNTATLLHTMRLHTTSQLSRRGGTMEYTRYKSRLAVPALRLQVTAVSHGAACSILHIHAHIQSVNSCMKSRDDILRWYVWTAPDQTLGYLKVGQNLCKAPNSVSDRFSIRSLLGLCKSFLKLVSRGSWHLYPHCFYLVLTV